MTTTVMISCGADIVDFVPGALLSCFLRSVFHVFNVHPFVFKVSHPMQIFNELLRHTCQC